MRFLYLIPSLAPSGASRQLEFLAQHQHRNGHQVEVCQFDEESSSAEHLRQQGMRVHSLVWKHAFDPLPLWHLHGLLRDLRPELIHVWHTSILRTLAVVGRKYLGRVVLSQPFSWRQNLGFSTVDRWLLRRVARVVVQSEVEARLGMDQGMFLDKIAVIPPGAVGQAFQADAKINWAAWPRKIVCVGPFERHKGHRDAIWAFDILRHIFEDAHLVFAGDGSDRPGLEKMARDAGCDHLTHFVDPAEGVADCLAQADICWIPSRRGGGGQTTLEAMLASIPVVACQVPSLHGLIIDGESGFIVPPGDKVAIARRTRQLFLDPDLARRLGSQARQRVLRHFSAPLFVERCRQTYQEVA